MCTKPAAARGLQPAQTTALAHSPLAEVDTLPASQHTQAIHQGAARQRDGKAALGGDGLGRGLQGGERGGVVCSSGAILNSNHNSTYPLT